MLDWYALAKQNGFDSPFEMIYRYYVTDKLTLVETAAEIGCSTKAVSDKMAKLGIEHRPYGGPRYKKRRAK